MRFDSPFKCGIIFWKAAGEKEKEESYSGLQCIDTAVFAKEMHALQAHDTKLNYMNMQFKAAMGLVMCANKNK